MIYVIPGTGAQQVATTTNNTPTVLCQFDVTNGATTDATCVVTAIITAQITSGLFAGSMGVAQLSRAYKYDISSNVLTAIGNLEIVNGFGGVVVLNVAPLVGDLAILLATTTLITSGSNIQIQISGLSGTSINWAGAINNVFIG